MFDYYRFRFSIFKGWNPELGYELTAPATVFGIVLVLFVLFLASPEFGFLMWRANMPGPAVVATSVVVALIALTYFADDLKRRGLWTIIIFCGVGLIATIPFTFLLKAQYAETAYRLQSEPPSAIAIGLGLAVYLSVILWLAINRLRHDT